MLTAYVRALGQLGDPRVLRAIGAAVLVSLLVFGLLWGGMAWLLTAYDFSDTWLLGTAIKLLGAMATLVSTLFLFPIVVSAMIGLWLEAIAAAVEARHYPELPAAPGLGLVAGLWSSLRFLLKALVVNVVLLLFLLLPALYPFAWILTNAYLLGREYFELVALRRHDLRATRALRGRHRLALLLGGVVATGLLLLPVVNLLAPVVVTMAMVHACQRWQPAAHPA
ncbi:MAG: EI24 domain-containing protein [Planctomycetota bacterium]